MDIFLRPFLLNQGFSTTGISVGQEVKKTNVTTYRWSYIIFLKSFTSFKITVVLIVGLKMAAMIH